MRVVGGERLLAGAKRVRSGMILNCVIIAFTLKELVVLSGARADPLAEQDAVLVANFDEQVVTLPPVGSAPGGSALAFCRPAHSSVRKMA